MARTCSTGAFRNLLAFILAGLCLPVGARAGGDREACVDLLAEISCPQGDEMLVGYVPIDSVRDSQLLLTLDEYFDARRSGDVDTLVELTISLSWDHRDIEEAKHRSGLERVVLHRYRHCALAVDETNPLHIWVFTPVVVTIAELGECHASALITEWVFLDGKWYTFPAGAPSFSGAKKSTRPNAIKRYPLSEEAAAELKELISAEPPN